MRVLHLPVNTASQISILVQALNTIGIDARGLVLEHKFTPTVPNVTPFRKYSLYKHQPLKKIALLKRFEAAIRWADIIHWHGAAQVIPKNRDLKYAIFLRKARIISFWGSEIRIPDCAIKDNPYLKDLLINYKDLYPISYEKSREKQEKFSRFGFECTIPGPELGESIQRDLFPNPYRIEASLTIDDFIPQYSDSSRKRPLVVHPPTNPLIKGTKHVLNTISKLQKKFDFDFKLIQEMPREEALALVRDSDIVLDQFIIGSFGTVSLEAMAYGKPVVCYLKPAVVNGMPEECPIVNAAIENLETVLSGLLTDNGLRHTLGVRGRKYIENYHDSRIVAEQLKSIYIKMLNKKNNS